MIGETAIGYWIESIIKDGFKIQWLCQHLFLSNKGGFAILDYKPVPVNVVMTNLTYAFKWSWSGQEKVMVLASMIHFNKPVIVTRIRTLNSQIGAFSCSYVFFCSRAASL